MDKIYLHIMDVDDQIQQIEEVTMTLKSAHQRLEWIRKQSHTPAYRFCFDSTQLAHKIAIKNNAVSYWKRRLIRESEKLVKINLKNFGI